MTGFNLWCPVCGGVLTQHGWTSEGHRLGRCTNCGEPATVTVHAHNVAGAVNRDAPFYPLVELVDGLARKRGPA